MSSSSEGEEDQEDPKPRSLVAASDQAYAAYLASAQQQPAMGIPPSALAAGINLSGGGGSSLMAGNTQDSDKKPKAKKAKAKSPASAGASSTTRKAAGKKRPAASAALDAGDITTARAAVAAAAGSYASKSAARGRGSFYVGRRKGFIDDSEIPENETPAEKKRRLNRNNERRKRARRVFKIDFLTERKSALTEKNDQIKKDNQALRDQIARVREHLESGGDPNDLSNLMVGGEGAVAILPAAEAAALAANSPSPAALQHSPDELQRVSATRVGPSPSPVQLAAANPTARPEATLAALQGAGGGGAVSRHGGLEQATLRQPSPPQEPPQLQMPQQPLPATAVTAATNNPLQSNEVLEALQRQALLLRSGLIGGGLSGGLAPSALGLGQSRQSLLESLRPESNPLQRLGAGAGGLGGALGAATPAEIAHLRQVLQAQQATALNPSLSSLAAANLGSGLSSSTGLGGLGSQLQLPSLARGSSDPLSPGSLQQRLLDLASRNNPPAPAAALHPDDDFLSQLRSQQQQQQQQQPASALRLSDLLSSAAGQASLAALGQLQQQQQQPPSQPNPFFLAALQQQSLQMPRPGTAAAAAPQGPRSLPATNVGALPSHNLPLAANLLQHADSALANARTGAGLQGSAFGQPSRAGLGGGWRDPSTQQQSAMPSSSSREASLMTLLAATELRRQEARRAEGDAKGDDEDEHEPPTSPGQPPSCPQS